MLNEMNPDEWDLLKVFYPLYSTESNKEMEKFLEIIGHEEYWTGDTYISDDGMYYFEWHDSEHERDSSGDHLKVYIRKIK